MLLVISFARFVMPFGENMALVLRADRTIDRKTYSEPDGFSPESRCVKVAKQSGFQSQLWLDCTKLPQGSNRSSRLSKFSWIRRRCE